MDTKTLLKIELEEAGFHLDEKYIEKLVPAYEQWCKYVKEARTVRIGNEEPASVFVLNTTYIK